jgi:ubiquinone/menaquinone biosynthesis C-methylase UbiE
MPTPHSSPAPRFLGPLLRWFFHHLYHSLAWLYDFVANAVSLGRWFMWIDLVIPFLQGTRILELAHGTGHLQSQLANLQGLTSFGLDESRQMAALTKRRAVAAGHAAPNLVRAVARETPFPAATFDAIVATFPTEFIFQPVALHEVHRLLKPGGRLVVLPVAWIVGRSCLEKAAAWLFAFTRQVPPSPEEWIRARLAQALQAASFEVAVHRLDAMDSIALVVVATKAM